MMDLLVPALPLLTMAGLLMAAPAPLAPAARPQGTVTLLAALMLGLMFSILMIRLQSGSDTITTSRIVATTLVLFASGLVAAPILDRARTGGIVLAAVGVGILTVPLFLHGLLPRLPAISGVAMLYAVLIVSVLTGLGGSMQLPMSTARFTADGARRVVAKNAVRSALGWVIVAFALILAAWTMLPSDQRFSPLPLLASGMAASLLQLFAARGEDALAKAGEGFAAGIVITLMHAGTLDYALVTGAIAGFAVMRSEAITTALRIDDAQQLTSIILIPSLLGLMLPALSGATDVGAVISWLAVAGGLGVLLPLLLWPLIKLTVGFATR